MRIFDVLLLALVPLGGCLNGGTCLRNSDCASTEVCSVGACVVAPKDDAVDGSNEAGDERSVEAGVPAPDVITTIDASGDASSDAADALTEQ
jgi:hypothetical protein